MGAVAVSRIVNEMEERASDGDTVALEALLPDLEAAFAQAREQLAAAISGTEAGE